MSATGYCITEPGSTLILVQNLQFKCIYFLFHVPVESYVNVIFITKQFCKE